MLFPIGDDNIKNGRFPFFSYAFLVINIAVFFLQFNMPEEVYGSFVETYGVIPAEITGGIDLQTLFTSMFLHGGFAHLAGNMLYLWIFADNIESTIGSFRFVIFYLVSGLISALAQVAVQPYSVIPLIGASGAIAGVMGAYIVMFPKSRVKMFFILFLSVFYIPSWVFLGFWFFQQMSSGLNMLNPGGTDAGGIAWWAHIGGFAFGLLCGALFRQRFVRPEIHRSY